VNSLPLVLVVAVAENGVIGRKGQLPWRIPGDLKHFKAVTMGKPVIMGRKTYESIGKPLPGRTNIVLTRDKNWRAEGVLSANSISASIKLANREAITLGARELTCIGGGLVFEKIIDQADYINLTKVHAIVDGDVYFPKIDDALWDVSKQEGPFQQVNDEYPYSLIMLARKLGTPVEKSNSD
jgi:dihydrofolate reductase